jgi:NAD(P)-dependent dehydrogenase (short-subunit alcohol dehydrogenase family)
VIQNGAACSVGAAAARDFAGQGATLPHCDPEAEEVWALERRLRATSAQALAKAVDTADESACRTFVDIACDHIGPPDVLVAAAGVCRALTPMLDLDSATGAFRRTAAAPRPARMREPVHPSFIAPLRNCAIRVTRFSGSGAACTLRFGISCPARASSRTAIA